MTPHTFILHNAWALGDTVCLSALARDIHVAYPGKYRLLMSGHYRNVFWINNPHAKPVDEAMSGQLIRMEYQSGIAEAGRGSKIHFLSWFHKSFKKVTGLDVPVTEPKGVISLTPEEEKLKADGRYWLIVAGGKMDMTAKVWSSIYWQQTVNILTSYGIKCVQAGGDFNRHFQPKLHNVEQWVGKTRNERSFFSLIAGAEGVICGITAAMHIAAVFNKPCVVIAGGREEPWWEGYTNCFYPTSFGPKCSPVKVEHTFLHTVGLFDCGVDNLNKGCWRDRAVPIEQADYTVPKNKRQLCKKPMSVGNQGLPECMTKITPDHVVEAVMNYYEKGILPPIGKTTGKYPLVIVPSDPVKQVLDAASSRKDFIDTNEQYVTIGVGRGPVGLEPIFTALDKLGPPPAFGWADIPKTVTKNDSESAEFSVLDHPYIGGKFTLFVLGYGDHLDLMERCVSSIINTCRPHRFDLRVALNQPSARLNGYVHMLHNSGIVTKIYTDDGTRMKYPAMREMFWDDKCPITTPYICWFDDDSWCRAPNWMPVLAKTITLNHAHQGRLYGAWMYHDLLGIKKTNPNAKAERWFREAPWWKGGNLYSGNGKRLSPNGSQIVFASGGFWALATHVIREANIPDTRLVHNGGDITIGAQVTQAGYKVVDFSPRPNKEIVAWSDAPPRGASHKGSGIKEFPWSVS